MEKKNQIWILIICSIVVGCTSNSNKSKTEEYYPNGKLKASIQVANGKKNGLTIYYYENGNIESIEHYVNDTINGEACLFNRSGFLEKTDVLKMGILDGPCYSFYPSGSLKDYRVWVNGKKQGYGEDYWDKGQAIKVIYFSKNDTLKFRRYFDSLGIVIKTEGIEPSERAP